MFGRCYEEINQKTSYREVDCVWVLSDSTESASSPSMSFNCFSFLRCCLLVTGEKNTDVFRPRALFQAFTVEIAEGPSPPLALPKLRLSFGVVCAFTRGLGLLLFVELAADWFLCESEWFLTGLLMYGFFSGDFVEPWLVLCFALTERLVLVGFPLRDRERDSRLGVVVEPVMVQCNRLRVTNKIEITVELEFRWRTRCDANKQESKMSMDR